MKRIVSGLIIVMLFFSFTVNVYGESCPLPKTNTDKEILFSGFEWYTDYYNTIAAAKAKGIVNEWEWSRDSFDEDSCVTPHWHTIYNSINSFAGSEKGCGGYLTFLNDIPDVAGYKIDSLKLYMMWNPEKGRVSDYKETNAVQFYMASYEFDVNDKEACYNDLSNKLQMLYGENTEEYSYGIISSVIYKCWVNNEGAMISLGYSEYGVDLLYMAPEAEEKLCMTEAKVKEQEISSAAGNMAGL